MLETLSFDEKPTLNESVLHQLACDLDEDPPPEDGAFSKLIVHYRVESRLYLAQIKDAIAAGDALLLRQAAHTLKSTSAIFGAERLSAISRMLEEIGRSGNTERASGLAQDAERELTLVLSLLPFPE